MKEVHPKDMRGFSLSCLERITPDLKTLEKQFHPDLEEIENDYNPFRMTQLQSYNPIYSVFFKDIKENNNINSNIVLNHRNHIKDLNTVIVVDDLASGSVDNGNVAHKKIFVKSSPLLDPIRYMIGKYCLEKSDAISPLIFPTQENIDDGSIAGMKLADINNASYVDNFFCFLSGSLLNNHKFIHGIEYYGSFLGIQDKYKFDISDDFDYLSNSTFFVNNNMRLFNIKNEDMQKLVNTCSRSNRSKLKIGTLTNVNISSDTYNQDWVLEDIEDDGVCDIHTTTTTTEAELVDVCEIYVKNDVITETVELKNQTNSSRCTSEDDSAVEDDSGDEGSDDEDGRNESDAAQDGSNSSADDNSEDWETETDSNSNGSDEEKEFAYIHNFPVQLICIEKCDGTFDELLEKEDINCEEGISALLQIIMILITYQKAFHFTHNDLHTNNIMYIQTDEEFLYYKYKNDMYRVPTYGKIYKIIDFGRAIYRYDKHLFCSDSFSSEGDAATQYNFEPYMNNQKPRIEPNYSFDLCRLGSSIYDFIIPDCDPDVKTFDDFQRIIYTWCLDDFGKSILYKKNGEERYHNFKLYKMIARTVHKHVPETQLEKPEFRRFLVDWNWAVKMEGDNFVDIDMMPCYV